MARSKKGQNRNIVDPDTVEILEGVEPPPILRESKYPWANLLQDPSKSFFVPCNSEEEARQKRTGIQSSGRHYVEMREAPLVAVSRVIRHKDRWGVGNWLLPLEEEEEE